MPELSLVHLVRQPKVPREQPPLLILLHGFGSNEQDLFSFAPVLDERLLIISARAPNTLEFGSYAWFDVVFAPQGNQINPEQAEASRQKLISFIQEAVQAYGANPQQVILMGFSQGAIMSASIALTRPELAAAVVMMSGRILPEIQPLIAPPEQLQGKPFLVVHGVADPVIPVKDARFSRDLLSKLPVELTYREYPMGHEVTLDSLGEIRRWLTNHLTQMLTREGETRA